MIAPLAVGTKDAPFFQSELALRRQRTLVALALGMLLMPAGAALDWVLYPGEFGQLLSIRFATTGCLALGLAAVAKLSIGRRIMPLSVVLLVLPALALNTMIYITDGGASSYYFGLILLMIIVHLLGFSAGESAVYCVITIAGYVLALMLYREVEEPMAQSAQTVQGLFFLLTSAVVCVLICYLNARYRLTTFLLQRQLRQQAQQRLDFVADVSHELRTPLSLIVAPIDELLTARGSLSEAAGQRLAMVRRSVDRLRLLVDDLLDVVRQRNTTLKMVWTETDARDFVEQVALLSQDMANENGLTLEVQGDTVSLPIRVDESRLERVLMNLLGNAFKFAPVGSTVSISARLDGDEILIQVADQGAGIPEHLLDQIFTRLYQAEDVETTRSAQGLGLGLAIAKEIVEWHGGRIRAENAPAGGAVFSLWLPVHREASDTTSCSATDATSAEPFAPSTKRLPPQSAVGGSVADDHKRAVAEQRQSESRQADRPLAPAWILSPLEATIRAEAADGSVLVIDDEPDLRGYLSSSLRMHYDVRIAANATDGLRLAREVLPNCILLDLMLPDARRLSALESLRADEQLRDTKILMLTATADETVKTEALQMGADDFLSKPFSITELKARVAGLVRSSLLQQSLREQREQLRASLQKLKQSEHRLLQSEKMRAIAGVAGGLLHEINNPVNFALMATRTLQKRATAGSSDAETLQDIHDGIARIGDIISDLRSFAHPDQDDSQAAFPVAQAVRLAQRFAIHDLGDIQLTINEDEAMQQWVLGSKSHVVQILLNLLSNASKAIRRKDSGATGEIRIEAKIAEPRLAVTVHDTGVGFTQPQLHQATEPFYTTSQQADQGLGIGLSICEDIIQSHGGKLAIQSQPDVGTSITFDLPLYRSA